MTGFASNTVSLALKELPLTITLQLKTVNARFIETTCKLPYGLMHLETEFIKIFKTTLHRGSIFFAIQLHNPNLLKSGVTPSLPIVKSYLEAAQQIKSHFDVSGELTISEILLLPSVFETPSDNVPQEISLALMLEVKKLIDIVIAERTREGAALQKDLQERTALMRIHIETLEPRATLVAQQRRETITQDIKKFLETLPPENKEYQLSSLYNQLEKIDIHEEIVRFKVHLDNLEKTIKSTEIELGKKLDFTLQECFREVNTMNSKCADSIIAQLAISIKIELEKAREQVQNII